MSALPGLSELLQRAGECDYFALLRLLSELQPDAAALGEAGPASREPARLRGHLSLSFPKRDIASATLTEGPEADQQRVELEIAFLSLYGVDSPLASHVTEAMLREHDPEARQRVRDFLDIFNHRLLSLLYRAWARYRLHVSSTRWGEDPLSRHLAELLDLPDLPAEAALSASDLLPLAGLFYARPRSACGLEQVLRALAPGMALRVLCCVPREARLPQADLNRLGRRRTRLGRDLVLGDTVWDATSKLRVQVGPVSRARAPDLQRGGRLWSRIAAAVELWCQEPLSWDLEIRLSSADFVGTRLGGDGPATRLGVDSWIGDPTDLETSLFVQPALGALNA